MSLIEDILQKEATAGRIKQGSTMEDLNYLEREHVISLLQALNSSKGLTVEDCKKYIRSNITAVESELVETDEFTYFFFGLFKRANRKQILLKARLKSYLLTEKLFTSHELAKEALKTYVTDKK